MNDNAVSFIQSRHIDSFQKLRFLLFLTQHPEIIETSQELATRLHLRDVLLIRGLATELQEDGLLTKRERCWHLSTEPNIKQQLQLLVSLFENPQSRQSLLDIVRHPLYPKYYQTVAFENTSIAHQLKH